MLRTSLQAFKMADFVTASVGTVAAVAAMAATLFCGSYFIFYDCHVTAQYMLVQ